MSHPPDKLRLGVVIGAIGVVFGDIGTSPLYTLQECLTGAHGVPPTPANVYGVLSLIFWSLTLIITVQYLFFIMRADNRGEGGAMALLSLIPAQVVSRPAGKIAAIALLALFGAALLFGDGIITPAISVLSAVEGLKVAAPSLDNVIVPLTVAILIVLFLVQRHGTARLGAAFGPIMIVWFVLLAALGVGHLVQNPAILGALLPHHAVRFFADNGFQGFRVLGGVMLAVTGGEALYADMGHFGRGPIRAGWLTFVYPALVLNYFGQGAMLLDHPDRAATPLYSMIPGTTLVYPVVVLAAAATVIASQALISGVFSLAYQAIRLGYFPRLTVRHTSHEAEGQIYLPLVNWGLAAGCIALVVVFRESSKLAAAYGLAVSGAMLITATLYYVVTHETWRWPPAKSAAVYALGIVTILPFVAANSLKFFDGGYLPLAIGVAVLLVMVVWRAGRALVAENLAERSAPAHEFLADVAEKSLGRVPGVGIYLSSQPNDIPPTLTRAFDRFRTMHDKTVILTVVTARSPHVAPEERLGYEDLGQGVYRVILHFGFMETPDVPAALEAVPFLGDTDPKSHVFVMGHERFLATPANRMGALSEGFFSFLARNARNATDGFNIPPDQVVEVGTHIDL
jgi:KUP system potassium uptake protein